MIEQKVLIQMGLSEKEAAVYLAAMELGKGTAVEISKKAQIKKPTTYVVLDSLARKGLVAEVPERRRTLYVAEDPRTLEKQAVHALEDFRELLPFFRARFNRGSKPKIRFYEGIDAIRNVYLCEIFPAETIYFYGTSVKRFTEVWPDLLPIWEKKWLPKKKHGKLINMVGNSPEDVMYAKQRSGHEVVRILPKGERFLADSVIADDKIFITSVEERFAVMVESHDLAETYRTLVRLAWRHAIPAEKWKK